jgi:adenine-specific DNA-methyltransferase
MKNKIAKASENIQNENLEKLRKVFPNFIKDGEIDFDALKKFFSDEDVLAGEEKYGLNWAGKSNAFKLIRTPAVGTLIPDEKESVDFKNTKNIFIEGDNLEVLKLLQKKYREQIKMIYIDPPYNTGKDFIYKDNFTEDKSDYYERSGQSENGIKLTTNLESNGRYHSDWLTMIYPRLFLARNLLKEDGVIFVSIDDNEVANLRLIMDEIFGEENFVGQITIVGNPRGRDYGGIARMHDYVLVYAKSETSEINNLNDPKKEFPFDDKKSGFEIRELRNRNIAFHSGNRPNLYYPFYVNTKKTDENGFFEISLEKKEGWFEVFPKESQGFNTVWRWGKPKSLENLNIEIAAKKMGDGGFMIIEKYREKTKMARSVWAGKDDNTEKGTLLIKSLFEGKVFDFPKSMDMIRKIIEMGSNKNDIILDFFAGSGTTAHAVMDLNAEDGGNRKFVCVQIPEETAEDSEARKAGYENIAQISRERIRRAGVKIGKGDIGFKAFSLSVSNYRQWNVLTDEDDAEKLKAQMKLFLEKPLVDGFQEKAVVYEILLKEGFDLNAVVEMQGLASLNVWKITDGERKMIITFSEKITKEQVEKLGLGENDIFVCLDSALDDTIKVNISRNLIVKVI